MNGVARCWESRDTQGGGAANSLMNCDPYFHTWTGSRRPDPSAADTPGSIAPKTDGLCWIGGGGCLRVRMQSLGCQGEGCQEFADSGSGDPFPGMSSRNSTWPGVLLDEAEAWTTTNPGVDHDLIRRSTDATIPCAQQPRSLRLTR